MSDNGIVVITGEENIREFRLRALYIMLRSETRTGMKRSNRGRSTLALVNKEMGTGFKRKQAALDAFGTWLDEREGK